MRKLMGTCSIANCCALGRRGDGDHARRPSTDTKLERAAIDKNVSEAERDAMAADVYHHPIGIMPADIDHMGHVNNSVYLKWVQEAVVRYWESLAPPEAVARHLWVALSHEIKYRRPAFLDDIVVADVIADRIEGAKALLHDRDQARRSRRRRSDEQLVLPRRGDAAAGATGARHRQRGSCRND